MAHPNPFDLRSPHSVRNRIWGVANQAEDVLDSDSFEHIHQQFR
jgi:hypothetical protein